MASGALLGGIVSSAGDVWLPVLTLVALGALAGRRGPLLAIALAALWVAVTLLDSDGARLATGPDLAVVPLSGRVVSLERRQGMDRLTVAVDGCLSPLLTARDCRTLRKVRLSRYHPGQSAMRVGQRWRLSVRLTPPAGLSNPGTFDYARWLWRSGIRATGWVVDVPPPVLIDDVGPGLRQRALQRLMEEPLPARTKRWLAALTLGAGGALDADDWALLGATGTTHLVVVSGLHVGLVATLALGLARGLSRLLWPRRFRMQSWPWWAAAFAAGAFVWLVGFTPAALRALVMTLVALWVANGRHSPGAWQGLCLAFAIVVMSDPLSLWRPGFWLSFVAVALLIVIWEGRRGVTSSLQVLWRTQWLLSPLMAGAVLLAFSRLAPAAPLVNLVAVPLVGMLVPLGLLGWALAGLWPALATLVWSLAGYGIEALVGLLGAAERWLPGQILTPQWTWPLGLGLMLLALVWGLPGVARPLRWALSACLFLGMVGVRHSGPGQGELDVRVWDVGQGLMVEVITARHRLLYDTGPRFRSGFTPLSRLWPPGQDVDVVVVSHADRDHAGGVAALRDEHRVGRWFHPAGEALPVGADAEVSLCQRGTGWRWEGVEFRFLWPPTAVGAGRELASNDRSCVLEIKADGRRLVLPGDAGSRIERYWLGGLKGEVSALVLGHHGSKTSSGEALVAALKPRHAIVSAGDGKRPGHPSPEVVRRLRRHGACLWNTAVDGQLRLRLRRGQDLKVTPARGLDRGAGGVGGRCHAVESRH
ncbi:DNA internalization-related competence protein ComEC/Rec2 [Halomonas sp. V046]|uniref:DNA internalization-related competence protein ComEC/Rec2 n=1 Tax=Halomonas sp. V046 TaxID=3459611 RepID=UPI004043AE78